jgi:hypothetical protein
LAVIDRLPGIFVDPVLPEERPALPPMDIAVFIGFAARGPCHRAIAVDSVAAFEACFGGDLPLARKTSGTGWTRASLPLTVRAFFANGGRRCWVVRVARNEALEAAWAKAEQREPSSNDVASAGRFPLDGILCRLPSEDGSESRVRQAYLEASSVGSWSDAMEVRTRLVSASVPIQDMRKVKWGMRFADPGTLEIGAMLELRSANDSIRRYARVVRREGSDLLAIWCSSFVRSSFARDTEEEEGHASLYGEGPLLPAKLVEGVETTITFASDPPIGLRVGCWLRFQTAGEAVWMQVRHLDDRIASGEGWVASGDAWQQIASRPPRRGFSARRISVEIDYALGGQRVSLGQLSPAIAGPLSLEGLSDDDRHYATLSPRLARGRAALALPPPDLDGVQAAFDTSGLSRGFAEAAALFGTEAFTAAHRRALRAAWCPLGLDANFSDAVTPISDRRPRLARDGLSRFDASLFLDPTLADSDSGSIETHIIRRRDQEEAQLFGIYAAADTPDTGFGIPSIIAVPDAAQPGWVLDNDSKFPGVPNPGGLDRDDWRTHAGGCPPDGIDKPLAAPDFSHFLNCGTQRLDTPILTAPAGSQPSGNFMLEWQSEVTSPTFILEESGDAAYAASAEVYRGPDFQKAITGRVEGAYYYRLRVESGGNSSDWAAAAVLVRASDYRATAVDAALLRTLHIATMRLAAGTAEMFALLAFPESWHAADLRIGLAELRALADGYGGRAKLGAHERRTLSYAAAHHPWLMYRTDREQVRTDASIGSAPPLGCVAGLMAATARRRGAWIAHANIAMTDIIGLSPSLPEPAQLPLYVERANMVRRMPDGFMLMDNDTLSDEPEWKQITTRRLMILLRRLAVERGNVYIFEPHGDLLRRAVENDFSRALDDMQRRGAFAGASSRESWALAVDAQAGNADNGQLVIEIGVAPSVPMRFLTLRLVQQGGRLSLAEEAA